MKPAPPHSFTAVRLSVIIPTFRRADGLRLAVESVLAQTGLEVVAVRIIVCDNSPEASARAMVAAIDSPHIPITYLHEPATGVANARNTALAATDDDFIAFLDDDEEAPADWLSKLLATQNALDADVVFGPVTARLMAHDAPYPDYFTAFFSRFGPDATQLIDHYYGCGNSLLRRAALPRVHEVFSVDRNDCGGEDDKLFYGMREQGKRMAWAADAVVWEDVPQSRSTLKYTLARAFAYGQGPSTSAMAHNPPKPFACAYWMINGAVQAVVFGILGGLLTLMRAKGAASALDKCARGLGKLIWFPPFKLGFYGTALLKTNAPGR
ncbi:glycosyltransferase family 2 protein [Asticcacaulis sp. ZE23SCel15]|uniref:glycosyltransferase family 2 protein n=1 Tax=Asticcacaulis sp. ZE23SCel15 TaxID=3059027 RepID=UPI00265F3DDA|nr:glycosyltransferase family 2 protein [Asticcacaulis sp. ZE23SCel15]WKL58840.1 glycosyltransferase family 2 protein [Asticcacaulis sp. ZE23SCel15]